MNYIKSPLNYIGGKYKLLPTLFPLFPTQIDTFVDLFAGGFNVGINVQANKIICNDQITYLIDLYNYLTSRDESVVLASIVRIIAEFQLSTTNLEGYNALRDRYNQTKDIRDFLVLTFYSFNHQIRFNSNHQFNTSFGKDRSCYNDSIEHNLIQFCYALHHKNIEFLNQDFTAVDLSALTSQDLVYCDPPYLISTGSYNDGKRGFKDWTETEEQQLLDLLDNLNARNVRFALSNVLEHKGQTNDLLKAWSSKYNVHYLDKSYSNCSYHLKDKDTKTIEVLITNYESDTPKKRSIRRII